MLSSDVALYIHIPFCRRKCLYCSFVSYENRNVSIPAYVTALQKELARYAGDTCVHSIYLGGGTPSLLSPSQLNDILKTIHGSFRIAENAEISMEANPGTIDPDYLTAVRKAGVNRLSLGIQSLHDPDLKMLGRIHTAAEAIEAVSCAREAGFDNLNLDLIYGLPGQSLADWQDNLDEIMQLQAEHLSLYCLTLEPGTPLYQASREKRLPPIDPDLAADQYELAEDFLDMHVYRQYEISNWARPGRECRHNIVYWQCAPYLGIGAAAHSYINNERFANTADLDLYIKTLEDGLPLIRGINEKIGRPMQLSETIIMGLRLNEGISIDSISNKFGVDIMEHYKTEITEMIEAGLLENSESILRVTRRGRLLSNEVFWRFLPK